MKAFRLSRRKFASKITTDIPQVACRLTPRSTDFSRGASFPAPSGIYGRANGWNWAAHPARQPLIGITTL
jgi:hypothetical protein